MVSDDVARDLDSIYTPELCAKIGRLMEKTKSAEQIESGIHKTARAFLLGKHEKQIEESCILKHSGRHLISAGQSSHRLAYALRQISKSALAQDMLERALSAALTQDKSYGLSAHIAANRQNGPAVSLDYLQEIAEALNAASNSILPLPERDDDAAQARATAVAFFESFKDGQAEPPKRLPANQALERAALTFRETWEEFSNVPYIRGRYKHERAGYDSLPAHALHLITHQLDSKLTESLCGTAIENIRKRPRSFFA